MKIPNYATGENMLVLRRNSMIRIEIVEFAEFTYAAIQL